MKTLSGIRAVVRQFLRDQFEEDSDYEWVDNELDVHIQQCLVEVSQAYPLETKETLKTTAGLAVASSLETSLLGVNNDLKFTAKTAGIAGNSITITYIDPEEAGDISVAVDGTDIAVTLAYAAGAITSTAADVEAAVEADGDAGALVSVADKTGNDGTGLVTAMTKTALSGGVDSSVGTERELSIASIRENLLSIDKVEYPVGKAPKGFRNFQLWGDTLEIDTTLTPSIIEDVYVYCNKVHTLTDQSSTLWPQLEGVLITGSVAYAALAWMNGIRTQVKTALSKLSDVNTAIGSMTARITQAGTDLTTGRAFIGVKSTEAIAAIAEMTARVTQAKNDLISGRVIIGSNRTDALTSIGNVAARVTQAIADLTAGRALIGDKRTEAITAIGNMTAKITQATTDLTTGRALIGSKRTEALAAISSMTAQLTQAISDLTSGRTQIADKRTTADTSITNMSARITQAIADLTTGRPLINKVNIGGAPEDDYARYAQTELGNSLRYLDQARGYLTEATSSDRYANYAARDMQVASGYLTQARGYLTSDAPTAEYSGYAARELQSAATYLNQARGYLELDKPALEYAQYAARELANANMYLNQARAYLATDSPVPEYAQYAARELANATTYLNQARAYLAVDQPAIEFGQYAARELSSAATYLNQAGGHIRQITSRLSTIGPMVAYERWANQKLMLYRQDLRKLAKPRTSVRYPSG